MYADEEFFRRLREEILSEPDIIPEKLSESSADSEQVRELEEENKMLRKQKEDLEGGVAQIQQELKCTRSELTSLQTEHLNLNNEGDITKDYSRTTTLDNIIDYGNKKKDENSQLLVKDMIHYLFPHLNAEDNQRVNDIGNHIPEHSIQFIQNNFNQGSSNQVFNGKVEGKFDK